MGWPFPIEQVFRAFCFVRTSHYCVFKIESCALRTFQARLKTGIVLVRPAMSEAKGLFHFLTKQYRAILWGHYIFLFRFVELCSWSIRWFPSMVFYEKIDFSKKNVTRSKTSAQLHYKLHLVETTSLMMEGLKAKHFFIQNPLEFCP